MHTDISRSVCALGTVILAVCPPSRVEIDSLCTDILGTPTQLWRAVNGARKTNPFYTAVENQVICDRCGWCFVPHNRTTSVEHAFVKHVYTKVAMLQQSFPMWMQGSKLASLIQTCCNASCLDTCWRPIWPESGRQRMQWAVCLLDHNGREKARDWGK